MLKKPLRLGICPEGGPMNPFPFDKVFPEFQSIATHGIEGCDAVLFWGGTDIHPSIYGAKRNFHSGASLHGLSKRDEFELKAMTWCKANDIPIIGVCRGAQLACAFSGGSLAQHVTGHGRDHMMSTLLDGEMMTTSSHHQMMNPAGTDGVILAWSTHRLSNCYQGETMVDIVSMKETVEPEIVWWPSTKALGIQGHPEWCKTHEEPFVQLCNKYVRRYCFGENV